MRLELSDGQWAELRERISHKTDRELKAAWRRYKSDGEDMDAHIIRAFVRDWYVRDEDSTPVPWTDSDAVERAESETFDAIAVQCYELWTAATTDPNAPTPD